jgi:hypothetical protein
MAMVEKTDEREPPEVLEQGHIFFIYRPKVRSPGEDEDIAAEDLDDVGDFYIVLKPYGGRFRLINIGRKRLPDIDGHERNWGFVEMLADSGREIEGELQRDTYETKTRAERVRPAARPAGEGVYALMCEGNKLHLVWALELPKQPGPVQKAFNIPQEASLAISIANPERRGGPRTAQLSEEQQANYPKQLQKEFRGRKFATEDPRLLDFEGAEIVFIGARTDPEEAYHIDLQPEQESEGSADIFRQLRFARSRHRSSRCSGASGASQAAPTLRATSGAPDGQAVQEPDRPGAAGAPRPDLRGRARDRPRAKHPIGAVPLALRRDPPERADRRGCRHARCAGARRAGLDQRAEDGCGDLGATDPDAEPGRLRPLRREHLAHAG